MIMITPEADRVRRADSSTTGTSSWRRQKRRRLMTCLPFELDVVRPSALSVDSRVLFAVEVLFAAGEFAVLGDDRSPAGCRSRSCPGCRSRCRLRRLSADPGRRRSGTCSRAGGCCAVSMILLRARFTCSSEGAVGRRRGRVALVVGARRREDEAGAGERADADVLGVEAREVAEGERPVVAERLLGASPASSGLAISSVLVNSSRPTVAIGLRGEFRQRDRGFGERVVELGGFVEVDGADAERVAEFRRHRHERLRARVQQVHELGRVFIELRLVGQRVDRLFQRGADRLRWLLRSSASLSPRR